MYVGLNQQIICYVDDLLWGMSVLLSGSFSDQCSNYIYFVVVVFMCYCGLFDVCLEDWIGFGLMWIDMSSYYVCNQCYMNQISGVIDYNDLVYQLVVGYLLNGEFYYCFCLVFWLELQLGLQYWYCLGGVVQIQDVWVVEWKIVVIF